MSSILSILQPIGDLFHTLFYEPIFNILMVIYWAVSHVWFAAAFPLSIIILTLLMRTCLIPLVRKQLRSQRTMQELQPKIAQLKRQYAGDQQGMLAAQQALFKEHGYSPISGCLPLLVQMPFLYALYYALFEVLRKANANETVAQHIVRINHDIYPFLPHITQMPQTWFLWTNLAVADPWHILPFVAAALTFVQLRMAMPHRKPVPASQKDATSQATQFTQYLMPVMTLIFGLSFPAGLPLYWSVSTGFSAVQQYFISGFGSLFVGLDRYIPALSRFIPEPQDVSPAALAASGRSPTGAAVRGGAMRAAVAEPPAPSGGGGGLRGMWNAIRAQATAQAELAQKQAEERQTAHNGGKARVVEGSVTPSSTENPAATNGRPSGTSGSASRSRRPRAERNGAMLVRPSTPAGADALSRSKGELPEAALAREATGLPPEVAAANRAANGADGANGASTKTNSAAPGISGAPAAPSGTTRAGSNMRKPQSGKGPNASRGRGNRPKGSR